MKSIEISKSSKDVFEVFEFIDSLTKSQLKTFRKIIEVEERNSKHNIEKFIEKLKEDLKKYLNYDNSINDIDYIIDKIVIEFGLLNKIEKEVNQNGSMVKEIRK
ncbi:MAG: hypothetical protein ACTSQA_00930 [Candidatus Heimdallarchaeaceae archaeon]